MIIFLCFSNIGIFMDWYSKKPGLWLCLVLSWLLLIMFLHLHLWIQDEYHSRSRFLSLLLLDSDLFLAFLSSLVFWVFFFFFFFFFFIIYFFYFTRHLVQQEISVEMEARFLVVSMTFVPSFLFCVVWPVHKNTLSIYVQMSYGNRELLEDEVSEAWDFLR